MGWELSLIALMSGLFTITKCAEGVSKCKPWTSGGKSYRFSAGGAFRPGMAICVRSAEPGLRHEIKISAARSRYGCITDIDVLFSYLKPFLGR